VRVVQPVVFDQTSSRRMTSPVRSFGEKNVLFGGINSPSSAVRRISAMLTGRSSTPAVA
jgi:hypothetical protein